MLPWDFVVTNINLATDSGRCADLRSAFGNSLAEYRSQQRPSVARYRARGFLSSNCGFPFASHITRIKSRGIAARDDGFSARESTFLGLNEFVAIH
jgi:hypothetical protein